jgi:16S rRNA (guanine966-N2)-methyltransferase
LNRVRIIGGTWRSRVLKFPDADGLRPTPDRVRETLFNWLGQNLAGLSCLDLFAGSGALGFEAASRHAERVVMIEQDRAVYASLQKNAGELEAPAQSAPASANPARLHLQRADALEWIGAAQRAHEAKYDVVFVDPPYQSGLLAPVFAQLPRLLNAKARIYAESAEPFKPQGYTAIRSGAAGQVHYQLLQQLSK